MPSGRPFYVFVKHPCLTAEWYGPAHPVRLGPARDRRGGAARAGTTPPSLEGTQIGGHSNGPPGPVTSCARGELSPRPHAVTMTAAKTDAAQAMPSALDIDENIAYRTVVAVSDRAKDVRFRCTGRGLEDMNGTAEASPLPPSSAFLRPVARTSGKPRRVRGEGQRS